MDNSQPKVLDEKQKAKSNYRTPSADLSTFTTTFTVQRNNDSKKQKRSSSSLGGNRYSSFKGAQSRNKGLNSLTQNNSSRKKQMTQWVNPNSHNQFHSHWSQWNQFKNWNLTAYDVNSQYQQKVPPPQAQPQQSGQSIHYSNSTTHTHSGSLTENVHTNIDLNFNKDKSPHSQHPTPNGMPSLIPSIYQNYVVNTSGKQSSAKKNHHNSGNVEYSQAISQAPNFQRQNHHSANPSEGKLKKNTNMSGNPPGHYRTETSPLPLRKDDMDKREIEANLRNFQESFEVNDKKQMFNLSYNPSKDSHNPINFNHNTFQELSNSHFQHQNPNQNHRVPFSASKSPSAMTYYMTSPMKQGQASKNEFQQNVVPPEIGKKPQTSHQAKNHGTSQSMIEEIQSNAKFKDLRKRLNEFMSEQNTFETKKKSRVGSTNNPKKSQTIEKMNSLSTTHGNNNYQINQSQCDENGRTSPPNKYSSGKFAKLNKLNINMPIEKKSNSSNSNSQTGYISRTHAHSHTQSNNFGSKEESGGLPNGNSTSPIKNPLHQTKKSNNNLRTEKENSSDLYNENNDVDPNNVILPNHLPTKCSMKRNGIILAYAANTNQGMIRKYNEDRVSIVLNFMRPPQRELKYWPRTSFFGLYDGHGGAACADFLRDNLHHFIIGDLAYPDNVEDAIFNGFDRAEKEFVRLTQDETSELFDDKSGSCAIVVLIVESKCYVANVGDSRAIVSINSGANFQMLSNDHRPTEEEEKKRILEGGGSIYQTKPVIITPHPGSKYQEMIFGPLRVLPGRLSVSRAFGDIQAKLEKYNGNPNVVIAVPDIQSFTIENDHDFIILGCDGIFDKLENNEVIDTIWSYASKSKNKDVHKLCGECVEYLLKASMAKRTLDNITVVLVALQNFRKRSSSQKRKKNLSLPSDKLIALKEAGGRKCPSQASEQTNLLPTKPTPKMNSSAKNSHSPSIDYCKSQNIEDPFLKSGPIKSKQDISDLQKESLNEYGSPLKQNLKFMNNPSMSSASTLNNGGNDLKGAPYSLYNSIHAQKSNNIHPIPNGNRKDPKRRAITPIWNTKYGNTNTSMQSPPSRNKSHSPASQSRNYYQNQNNRSCNPEYNEKQSQKIVSQITKSKKRKIF